MTAANTLPDSRTHGAPPGDVLYGVREIGVLAGIFLAILMAGLDALVVNTTLPTIAASLHQVNGITFVVSTYLITSTISIPIFARLSDIASRRNVFLAGLVIFIAGSALAGFSQNLGELIFFRGVQGFGSGGFLPVGIAMVAVLLPPASRARATGILSGAGGLSIVVGPLLGSWIVDTTTWRWVFYINLPFGIAGFLVLLLALGPLRPDHRGRFDLPGAALLTGWVAALMFALVQVSEAGWAWTDPRTLGLFAAALVLLGVFLAWELRVAEPLIPFRFLRRRLMAAAAGVSLFNGIAFTSVLTFLSVFIGFFILQGGAGSANSIRDVIYFFAVPMILGAAVCGQLVTKLSYRSVIAPGLAVATLAGLTLATLSPTSPLWLFHGDLLVGGLVLPLIPMGFGLGLALSGSIIAVMNEAPVSEVGGTIGLMRFFQSLGGAVGLSLLTGFEEWRAAALAGASPSPQGVLTAGVTAYDEVFLALALVIGVAFVFALFLHDGVRAPAELPTAAGSRVPPLPPEPGASGGR
jgi:EmrB/QacA subfamily drug resistance transporter